jgi:hypothetical protein
LRCIAFTNENPEKLKQAQSVLKDINEYAKRAPNPKPDTIDFFETSAAIAIEAQPKLSI